MAVVTDTCVCCGGTRSLICFCGEPGGCQNCCDAKCHEVPGRTRCNHEGLVRFEPPTTEEIAEVYKSLGVNDAEQ